jgi:hypothetical protein
MLDRLCILRDTTRSSTSEGGSYKTPGSQWVVYTANVLDCRGCILQIPLIQRTLRGSWDQVLNGWSMLLVFLTAKGWEFGYAQLHLSPLARFSLCTSYNALGILLVELTG